MTISPPDPLALRAQAYQLAVQAFAGRPTSNVALLQHAEEVAAFLSEGSVPSATLASLRSMPTSETATAANERLIATPMKPVGTGV